MPTKTQQQTAQKHTDQKSNPVVWFEMPVTDLERAKKFYGNVFGFSFQMNEAYGYKMAMINAAQENYGCGGALIMGESYVPSYEGAVVYFHIPSIEDTLKKINKAGGKTIQEKKSIGEYGWIAFFEDSEGNRVALHTMAS